KALRTATSLQFFTRRLNWSTSTVPYVNYNHGRLANREQDPGHISPPGKQQFADLLLKLAALFGKRAPIRILLQRFNLREPRTRVAADRVRRVAIAHPQWRRRGIAVVRSLGAVARAVTICWRRKSPCRGRRELCGRDPPACRACRQNRECVRLLAWSSARPSNRWQRLPAHWDRSHATCGK